jgi:hypothetical protein
VNATWRIAVVSLAAAIVATDDQLRGPALARTIERALSR